MTRVCPLCRREIVHTEQAARVQEYDEVCRLLVLMAEFQDGVRRWRSTLMDEAREVLDETARALLARKGELEGRT